MWWTGQMRPSPKATSGSDITIICLSRSNNDAERACNTIHLDFSRSVMGSFVAPDLSGGFSVYFSDLSWGIEMNLKPERSGRQIGRRKLRLLDPEFHVVRHAGIKHQEPYALSLLKTPGDYKTSINDEIPVLCIMASSPFPISQNYKRQVLCTYTTMTK